MARHVHPVFLLNNGLNRTNILFPFFPLAVGHDLDNPRFDTPIVRLSATKDPESKQFEGYFVTNDHKLWHVEGNSKPTQLGSVEKGEFVPLTKAQCGHMVRWGCYNPCYPCYNPCYNPCWNPCYRPC